MTEWCANLASFTDVSTTVEAGGHITANLADELRLVRFAQTSIAARHRHELTARLGMLFKLCETKPSYQH